MCIRDRSVSYCYSDSQHYHLSQQQYEEQRSEPLIPLSLIHILAGVDMASPQPVKMAMETFKDLVDELEKIL